MRSALLALSVLCALGATGCGGSSDQCSPEERCGDGIDNDCDGKIDEGCDCVPQSIQNCGVGECVGQQQCNAGSWGPCVGGKDPEPEICDGKDNDCDGVIDNGDNACGGACDLRGDPGTPCDGPDADFCKEGEYVCVAPNELFCTDITGTLVEICGNGIDDNCDGRIDEYCGERTLVWSDFSGSTVVAAQAQAQAVTVGADNTIYVVGQHTHDVTFGGSAMVDAGTSPDAFVLSYTAAGHLNWHVDINGTGDATAAAIAIDPTDGSLVVVGNFGGAVGGSVNFDGTTTKTPIAQNDGYVARYSSTGTLVRVVTFGSDSDDEIYGVAVDATGHVAITGRFLGTSLGLGGITVPRSNNSYTYFTAYLDSTLTPQWARRAEYTTGTLGDIAGRGVAFDGLGNVYVAAASECYQNCNTAVVTVDVGQADATPVPMEMLFGGFVASYDSTGHLRWAAAGAPGNGIAIEGSAVYVTGQFGAGATFGANTITSTTIVAAGGFDGFVARYGTDGAFAWVRQLGSATSCVAGLSAAPDDSSNAIAASNGPVIAGANEASPVFAPDLTLTASGYGNVFWAGYDPTGAINYAHDGDVGVPQCQGGGGAYGVAVAPNGNVVVVGTFIGHLIFPTLTLPVATNEDAFFVAVFSP